MEKSVKEREEDSTGDDRVSEGGGTLGEEGTSGEPAPLEEHVLSRFIFVARTSVLYFYPDSRRKWELRSYKPCMPFDLTKDLGKLLEHRNNETPDHDSKSRLQEQGKMLCVLHCLCELVFMALLEPQVTASHQISRCPGFHHPTVLLNGPLSMPELGDN